MVKKFVSISFTAMLILVLGLFLFGCSLENLPKGELIDSSVSPLGTYTVNAYRCSGNATTDFSVRCEVIDSESNNCRNIYWKYHQEDVDLNWIDNENIEINGLKLNVLTDAYDWRNE